LAGTTTMGLRFPVLICIHPQCMARRWLSNRTYDRVV
jgi:hypothetical protein